MSKLVLGIDLGTSYFKFGLYDQEGTLRGQGRISVPKDPDGDRCELPVDQFWAILREGLCLALEEAGAQAGDIQGLSYASQTNSFLLLDAQNKPLTPLILWPDQRASPVDDRVNQLWNRREFLKTTGLGIEVEPSFAVAKILWFQEQHPAIWSKTSRIQTIADYLVFSLTEDALTDEGTSSLLGLWDLQYHQWWRDGLDCLGISEKQLSTPLRPGSSAGTLTKEGGELLGLRRDVSLTVGSLDHHMAALGAGVGTIAPVSVSFGTVLACLSYAEEFAPTRDCCLGPGVDEEAFFQLAFCADGASGLEWYQQTHAPDLSLEELSRMAGDVPSGCEGLKALPSAHRFPDLEGFTRVTDRCHHGHCVRAIMESVAHSLDGLLRQLFPNQLPSRVVAAGGGARSAVWLQICADTTGVEFVATQSVDTACLGAAMLAACNEEWFQCMSQVPFSWRHEERVVRPNHR